jgi:4-hydroxy-tetrahydrodipicolinate reductase
MKRIKVAQFGLGPIGLEAVRLAAAHGGLELVGGVDIDPGKVGRPLAELAGLPGRELGQVYRTCAELLAATQPEVVLHTAASSAAATLEQMRPVLERGLAVASTCEELIFPALRTPALAAEYDALCRRTGARLVATGVNPGFVMDVLPICLTGVCREVKSIYVERVVDASTRRQPLQAKIGSGQDPAAFAEKFKAGKAGHAGFKQSLALLAHAMGWTLDEIRETCAAVVTPGPIVTKYFAVAAGQSAGIHQRCVGLVGGEAKITLDLQMYLGAPNPHDTIVVRGRPDLTATLNGGVAGDDATVAALLNAVPRLLGAAPGLRLMTELPLPAWQNGLPAVAA